MAQTVVSVGTTRVRVGRGGAFYKNNGPVTVFLGEGTSTTSDVTADTSSTGGWQLHPGQEITFQPGEGSFTAHIWAVTASGTAFVSVMKYNA